MKMVDLLKLEVCKMYSVSSARKVSFSKNFVLAVFLSVVCYLLAAPASSWRKTGAGVAYAGDNIVGNPGRYALEFDGQDDYVQTPISAVPKDGTVEAWVKTVSNAREAVFSSYGDNQEFRLHVNYQPGKAGNSPGFLGLNVRFRTLTGYTEIGSQMYDGNWHYVAFVWEGASPGTIRAYWDGQEKPVTYRDHNAWEGNYDRGAVHVIGREDLTNNLYYFAGKIDEVRFWNKSRTQSEIQQYLSQELLGDEEGLTGYWKFNEGEGTTANDSSPNKNHGTIAGASWTTDAAPVQSALTEAFTFVQVSDPQLGWGFGYENDVNSFKQAVRRINSLKPDFVVICGDLVNSFNDQSVADFNNIKSKLTMPCYCAPGNHDVGNTPTDSSLNRYRQAIGKDYFSFEHKGYTFVIANTQLWKAPLAGESEKHDAWFKQTLEAARDKNSSVFVAGHYPLYLKDPNEAEEYYNLPPAKRGELLALMEDCGVVAVLGGHRHELVINEYKGIQLVNGEATSRNTDGRPLGFRLWHVDSPKSIRHEFIPLKPEGIDFNGDEKVDMQELCRLTRYWLQDEASVDVTPGSFGDNIVNFKDMAVLAEYWRIDLRLLAHWMLDETEGSVAYDSAGSNDGVLIGNPVWQPTGGKVDGALQLDGIDDYVSTANYILDPASQAFSVFAWIKGGAPGQVIISQIGYPSGVNWLNSDPSEGSLMTELMGAGRAGRPLISKAVITDGQWHRIGFVWDGSGRRLYVDDVQVATDTQDVLKSSGGGLYIGAGSNLAPASFWSGLIDDVRIYDQAVMP